MRVPGFLRGLKEPVKRARHRARAAFVARFHAFTPAEFRDALRRVGVEPGDVLCVHSSFDRFQGFRGNLKDALQVLQDVVGAEGGLMMPTQPFTGTALDWVRTHPVTDLGRAPSLMGLMTEVLRRTPGVVRSINPTHPVAVWGPRGHALVSRDWEARTPCGRGTAYHRLLEGNGKIVMLGTSVQTMTFFHCVEELIEPMMPFSPFTAEELTLQTKDVRGQVYTSHMQLFEPTLSARRRLSPLVPELKARGFWHRTRVGGLEILCFRAADVAETLRSMAAVGRFCYLPESPINTAR